MTAGFFLVRLADRFRRRVVALCVALCVSACSPGGDLLVSGGVGSGGTGLAEGFLSGYGSLIVDGVPYDDSNAVFEPEALDGQSSDLEPRLGQRVRLSLREDGSIRAVQVRPQLRGPITRPIFTSDGARYIEVLGQLVRVIDQSEDGFDTTILEGSQALANLSTGDLLEVHGSWLTRAAPETTMLAASRIEKLATLSGPYKLSGKVEGLDDRSIAIGSGWALQRPPDGALGDLAVGTEIEAWVEPTEWLRVRSTQPQARIIPLKVARVSLDPTSIREMHLRTTASPSQFDAETGRLMLGDLSVRVPETLRARLTQLAGAARFHLVRGEGGELELEAIKVASLEDDFMGRLIRVKTVLRWPDPAPDTVSLRGTMLSGFASAASSAASCAAIAAGQFTFVEIAAERGPPGTVPTVTELICSATPPERAVYEDEGEVIGFEPAQGARPPAIIVKGQAGVASQRLELPETLHDWSPSALQALIGSRVRFDFQMQNGQGALRRLRNPQ